MDLLDPSVGHFLPFAFNDFVRNVKHVGSRRKGEEWKKKKKKCVWTADRHKSAK